MNTDPLNVSIELAGDVFLNYFIIKRLYTCR